jgi:hypothetical protein
MPDLNEFPEMDNLARLPDLNLGELEAQVEVAGNAQGQALMPAEENLAAVPPGAMILDMVDQGPVISENSVSSMQQEFDPPEIVLALQAAPTNFLHLEIQPQDLVNDGDLLAGVDDIVQQQNPLDDALVAQESLPQLQANAIVEEDPHPVDSNNSNQQVGMVLLSYSLDFDPGWASFQLNRVGPNAEATRLWAKHFAPSYGLPQGISTPESWRDFLSQCLLNPCRFDWAKSFLLSGAWKLTVSDKHHEESYLFALLNKCPVTSPLLCLSSEGESEDSFSPHDTSEGSSTTPSKAEIHLKRKASKVPLVVSEVRRSERIKKLNDGFKSQACKEKSCFCCSIEPQLCQID